MATRCWPRSWRASSSDGAWLCSAPRTSDVGATGDSHDFEEVIDTGSRCVERVEIRITVESADRLQYSTELPWAATATLRRGSLQVADPEEVAAAMGWPTEAQDATSALMVWFGAASATGNSSVGMPKWVSCARDNELCIAGGESVVGVIQRRPGGFYETHTVAIDRPARESLLGLGFDPGDVDQLLAD